MRSRKRTAAKTGKSFAGRSSTRRKAGTRSSPGSTSTATPVTKRRARPTAQPWACSRVDTSPSSSSRPSHGLWTRRSPGSFLRSLHTSGMCRPPPERRQGDQSNSARLCLRVLTGRRNDMAATREARAVWNGDLLSGTGMVSAVSSGKFSDLPVSWSARTEAPGGKSSPEELLAAAHASCFAMALSAGLGRAGTKPNRLEVSARVTFDKVGDNWTVVSSELDVKGDVPGSDAAKFVRAAEDAKDNCPISRALKGNVKLSVQANLSS